jgi:uncharacterized protein YyaL (SSP411 family)
VYYYSPDLTRWWGEGEATKDQVWVQPPGTPTVGMAYLKAYAATGDKFYLEAATEAAEALVYGQLASGGWTNCICQMKPIWARKFEPPAICGDESQEVIETLMTIYRATGESKYLEPIPRAVAYLKRSLLPDGRLARYYELNTNKPLYMSRRGDVYKLTYDDSKLPGHYGWKTVSRLDEIEKRYNELSRGVDRTTKPRSLTDLESEVRKIREEIDDRGRWVSTSRGEPLVGQPKFPLDAHYISSDVFSRNLTTLSEYLEAVSQHGPETTQ